MSKDTMTAAQFRIILDDLGLTQSQAAELFEISDRTIRRYAVGDFPVPRVLDIALTLIAETRSDLSRWQK